MGQGCCSAPLVSFPLCLNTNTHQPLIKTQDEVALHGAVVLPHKEVKESLYAPQIIL
jgi:hypothetical protein